MNTSPSTQKNTIGTWRGGWLLARASWSALQLDRELVIFPIYSFLTSAAVIGLIGLSLWATGWWHLFVAMVNSSDAPALPWLIAAGLLSFIAYLTTNFFTTALISSALHRFEGGDPDVTYGLAQARSKFGSLVKFSLLMATVGFIFQLMESRKVPLVARIIGYIIDVAWSVATIFAIPVIAASAEPIGPIEAVRKSAAIFKKAWSKDFTGGLSLALIFLPALLSAFLAAFFAGVLAVSLHSVALIVAIIVFFVIVWVTVNTLFSALNGIFHAALYHYATTGQPPAEFDKELLHAAFKPKKKWFI